jgi:hypothetical protein
MSFNINPIFILTFLLAGASAHAAEFGAMPIDGVAGVELLTIKGEIVAGDANKFRIISANYPKALVALASKGGAVMEALDIGTQIRMKGYGTLVPSNEVCASACANIWLAGTPRFMSPNSLIGFHSAWKDVNGEHVVASEGDALIGSYLGKLGLPDAAVAYVTAAPPDGIQWLNAATAKNIGIDVQLMPNEQVATTAPPPPAPAPVPAASAPITVEQALSSNANWSAFVARTKIGAGSSYRKNMHDDGGWQSIFSYVDSEGNHSEAVEMVSAQNIVTWKYICTLSSEGASKICQGQDFIKHKYTRTNRGNWREVPVSFASAAVAPVSTAGAAPAITTWSDYVTRASKWSAAENGGKPNLKTTTFGGGNYNLSLSYHEQTSGLLVELTETHDATGREVEDYYCIYNKYDFKTCTSWGTTVSQNYQRSPNGHWYHAN